MSVHQYDSSGHAVRRFTSDADESYFLDTAYSPSEPSSLDDWVEIDGPEAELLAQADTLVGAWRELCESCANLSDSNAARQTLRECLSVMEAAIDSDGGTDPGAALALLQPAA